MPPEPNPSRRYTRFYALNPLSSRNYPNQDVAISVKGQRLRLALSLNRDLFEPKIFGEAVRKRDFEEIIELFQLIEELIRSLGPSTAAPTPS